MGHFYLAIDPISFPHTERMAIVPGMQMGGGSTAGVGGRQLCRQLAALGTYGRQDGRWGSTETALCDGQGTQIVEWNR